MSVRLEAGTLLLSAPSMRDSNFMHTVIVMWQHDDDGAFGLVVNGGSQRKIADLFPDHPILGALDLGVRCGGPVGLDTLQVLHRIPAEGPLAHSSDLGGVDLGAGLRIGADLDQVARYVVDTPDPDRHVRFVVGYSGWGEGQLDAEIRSGSWLPLAAAPDIVFLTDEPGAVWRAAMGRLAGGGPALAHLPPDPTWN